MNTTSNAPTARAALDYVRNHFTGGGIAQAITICGTIAPGRDSSGPIEGSRDVLFLMPGETGRPNRFTIWHDEALGGALYGEW